MGLNLPSGKLSIKTYSSQFLGFTIWDLAYLIYLFHVFSRWMSNWVPRYWYLENINQIKKNHLNLQKHLNIDLHKNFSDNVIYIKTRA